MVCVFLSAQQSSRFSVVFSPFPIPSPFQTFNFSSSYGLNDDEVEFDDEVEIGYWSFEFLGSCVCKFWEGDLPFLWTTILKIHALKLDCDLPPRAHAHTQRTQISASTSTMTRTMILSMIPRSRQEKPLASLELFSATCCFSLALPSRSWGTRRPTRLSSS